MQTVELKLKQASAVLGVSPKDLQNLVQLNVLKPSRKDAYYWFDTRRLLEAKVTFYLKESLGASTEVLARFAKALSRDVSDEDWAKLRYLRLSSRPARGREAIEVRIPLRDLARELDEQLPRAQLYQDLPRGRKRPGWKGELVRNLEAAADDLAGITSDEIQSAICGYRADKKGLPEVTVGGEKRSA
jgi:DNA-binding transcriptional MerR regulator